jgi:hypothetical protein
LGDPADQTQLAGHQAGQILKLGRHVQGVRWDNPSQEIDPLCCSPEVKLRLGDRKLRCGVVV